MAGKPVLVLARKTIRKRFARVLEDGSTIDDQTPDEVLHELRIDCKKLRYLLEFFRSLFPADEMKTLIAKLKKLQTLLGDFNDLCVQRDYLQDYVDRVLRRRRDAHDALVAVGFLMGLLHAKKDELRTHFQETFATFSSEENRARFRDLFGERGSK